MTINAQTPGIMPVVTTLDEAEFWIQVMHRRTCADAEARVRLMDRIRVLEAPWWKRWLVRRRGY